jgi:hypothetical protein
VRQGVDTCAQDPKYTVQDLPVVNTGNAARLVRKERPDGSPFKVREFVPHDSRLRLGRLNHVQTGAFNRQKRTTGISEITLPNRTCHGHAKIDANYPDIGGFRPASYGGQSANHKFISAEFTGSMPRRAVFRPTC